MKNRFYLLFACFLILMGCKHNPEPTPSDGPFELSSFTASPIQVSNISYLLSLGWIQPVGHTIPTDHVYFWYTKTNNTPVPVFAPGGGRVQQILNVPVGGIAECKVWIKMNDQFMYYLDHIVLDASIKEGTTLKAGQQLATTGLSNSIDLGVIDNTITVPFANPLRYGLQTIHYTDGPTGWDKELSFAYDIQHPANVLVSIGGVLGLTGKWNLLPGVIFPADITSANGKIAYPLWSVDPNSPHSAQRQGLMIVQMTDNTHIKVQVFAGSTASDAAFDSNAKLYAR